MRDLVVSGTHLPPGPKGKPIVGVMPEWGSDALGTVTRYAREYGDMVTLPLGPMKFIMVTDPALIEQVLVHQSRKFVKGGLLAYSGRLLGEGLVTSSGEHWLRHRRLIQPAFHGSRIAGYGRVMVEHGLRHAAQWSDGRRCDIAEEMMELTLAIVVKTLFGTELDEDSRRVGEALYVAMDHIVSRFRSVVKLPEWLPTPAHKRADRAFHDLDAIVYRLIDKRQAGEGLGDDLLTALVQARDEQGEPLSRTELRDEVMTLLLAGHETTALAMTWALWLLARHPEAEARLHAELAQVLNGRPPEVADLARLPFADGVIKEALRLYPPTWAIPRKSVEPFELGGYQFPAETTVFTPQWVVQRDARFFSDPETFQPERWLDGLAKRLPTFAYFPFGGGPRRCIGASFAEMEAVLLLVTLCQHYSFRPVEEHPIKLEPLITLRPKHGIQMSLHKRIPAAVPAAAN